MNYSDETADEMAAFARSDRRREPVESRTRQIDVSMEALAAATLMDADGHNPSGGECPRVALLQNCCLKRLK